MVMSATSGTNRPLRKILAAVSLVAVDAGIGVADAGCVGSCGSGGLARLRHPDLPEPADSADPAR